MSGAVFLDRDGVINENRADHVKSLAEFVVLPGALEALALLRRTGLPVIVVSNQSAINRGLVSWDTVSAITRELCARAEAAGGRIEAVLTCPHRPDVGCACRKPRPGLLHQAACRLGVELADCTMIGDALSDVQAALAVGAQPLMVLTGRGREQAALLEDALLASVPVFDDLLAAARWVFEREQGKRSADRNPLRDGLPSL